MLSLCVRGRFGFEKKPGGAGIRDAISPPPPPLAGAASASTPSACTVRRGELVDLGGLWLEGHGLSEGCETLGLSSRVRRAAPSLQMQADEPVEARRGLAKTAN